MGYVYIMQYGKYIKVGCTKNPCKRIDDIKHIAEDYNDNKIGKIYLSIPHIGYRYSESCIHKSLSKYRINKTELFNIDIKNAVELSNDKLVLDKKVDDKPNKFIDAVIKIIKNDNCNYDNLDFKKYFDFEKMSYEDLDYAIKLFEEFLPVQQQYLLLKDQIIDFMMRFAIK